MTIEIDDLYTIIGELYVRTQILEARVKELTPKPDAEVETSWPYHKW